MSQDDFNPEQGTPDIGDARERVEAAVELLRREWRDGCNARSTYQVALKSVRRLIQTLPPAEATGPRRKFSGNSLRCRRRTVLYHGTLLYDFDLALIPRWLAEPPRQPEYRVRRAHGEFVANLPLTRQQLDQALRTAFGADELLPDWPRGRVAELVAQRYADPKWRLPTAT